MRDVGDVRGRGGQVPRVDEEDVTKKRRRRRVFLLRRANRAIGRQIVLGGNDIRGRRRDKWCV